MTIYKENIVGYIGGFVVRKMLKSLHCSTCAEALLGRDNHHERYLTLTHIKDNGGLIIPSDDVFKILKKAESFFVSYISGRPGDDVQISACHMWRTSFQIKYSKNCFQRTSSNANQITTWKTFLRAFLHSTQLIKKVISFYLQISFFRYGEHYSSVKIKKSWNMACGSNQIECWYFKDCDISHALKMQETSYVLEL